MQTTIEVSYGLAQKILDYTCLLAAPVDLAVWFSVTDVWHTVQVVGACKEVRPAVSLALKVLDDTS